MNNGEDCPRCLGWTFDDEPCKSMLCQGIAEGRRLERAAIVSWLRDQASDRYLETDYHTIADKLENGEHEEGA